MDSIARSPSLRISPIGSDDGFAGLGAATLVRERPQRPAEPQPLAPPAAPVWTDPRPLRLLGIGAAVPGPAISTEALLDRLDARFGTDLKARGLAYAGKLGVRARHIVRDFAERREGPRRGDSAPELAARAIRSALNAAGMSVGELSYLVGHTATPALPIPSNIALAADLLGFEGPHMELRQACTGFANALVIAQGLLSTPGCRAVAIVGSETGSVHFDPLAAAQDPSQLVNLVMMGDAAAAVIVTRAAPDAPGPRIERLFYGQVGAGRSPGLSRPSGGSAQPWSEDHVPAFAHDFEHVRTTGPELFLRGAAALTQAGLDPMEADRILPHQASGRIAHQFEAYLGMPAAKVFVNADRRGNTGSAAIWLALHDLAPELAPGARVAVLGAEATKHMFGGFGYTHG